MSIDDRLESLAETIEHWRGEYPDIASRIRALTADLASARAEVAQLRGFHSAIAEAFGMIYEPDTGPTYPAEPAALIDKASIMQRTCDIRFDAQLYAERERDAARGESERLQVQLAGCLTVAEGGTKDPATEGMFGWSLAYQKTLELRLRCDAAQAEVAQLRAQRDEAAELLTRVHRCPNRGACTCRRDVETFLAKLPKETATAAKCGKKIPWGHNDHAFCALPAGHQGECWDGPQ